jgi:hypothetical protein
MDAKIKINSRELGSLAAAVMDMAEKSPEEFTRLFGTRYAPKILAAAEKLDKGLEGFGYFNTITLTNE